MHIVLHNSFITWWRTPSSFSAEKKLRVGSFLNWNPVEFFRDILRGLKKHGMFVGGFCWYQVILLTSNPSTSRTSIENPRAEDPHWNPSKGSKGLDQKTFTVDENPSGRRSPTFTIPNRSTKKGWISRKEKMSLKRKSLKPYCFSPLVLGPGSSGNGLKGNKCWHKDFTNHFSLVMFARFHSLFSASSPPPPKTWTKDSGKSSLQFSVDTISSIWRGWKNDGQFIRDWPGHGCFGGNHSGWSFTGPDFRCKNSCHTGLLGYHADEIYRNTVYKHVAQDKSEEPHMCAELIQHAVFFFNFLGGVYSLYCQVHTSGTHHGVWQLWRWERGGLHWSEWYGDWYCASKHRSNLPTLRSRGVCRKVEKNRFGKFGSEEKI